MLIRRIVSTILLVSFIVTSSDAALALAPSGKLNDEVFHKAYASLDSSTRALDAIGESLYLKMPLSGVREMVERRIGKGFPITIDRVENDTVFFSFRDPGGEIKYYRCFLADDGIEPIGATKITLPNSRVYWRQEISETWRRPIKPMKDIETITVSDLTEDEIDSYGIGKLAAEAMEESGFWVGWDYEYWGRGGRDALVALEGGKAVAIWSYLRESGISAHSDGIYITKIRKGNGLGRLMREKILNHLSDKGFKRFRIGGEGVNAIRKDPAAQGLWKWTEDFEGKGAKIVRDGAFYASIDIDIQKVLLKTRARKDIPFTGDSIPEAEARSEYLVAEAAYDSFISKVITYAVDAVDYGHSFDGVAKIAQDRYEELFNRVPGIFTVFADEFKSYFSGAKQDRFKSERERLVRPFSGLDESQRLALISWYRGDSFLCDYNAPQIRKMAQDITAGCMDDDTKLERLAGWVKDNISYGMGHGGYWDAPASETLARRHGMCFNQSNLFIALARSLGIRCEYGIVMVNREAFRDFVPPARYSKMRESSEHIFVRALTAKRQAIIDFGGVSGEGALVSDEYKPSRFDVPGSLRFEDNIDGLARKISSKDTHRGRDLWEDGMREWLLQKKKASREGGSGVSTPAEDINRIFPKKYSSVNGRRFLEIFKEAAGEDTAGEAARFAKILDLINPVTADIYKTLRDEFGEPTYPQGCGYISSGLCKFLNERGFNVFVRTNLHRDHHYLTVRLSSDKGPVYFLFDYTPDQFIAGSDRGRPELAPIAIPVDALPGLSNDLRVLYETDEEGDYVSVISDDNDPAAEVYKILARSVSPGKIAEPDERLLPRGAEMDVPAEWEERAIRIAEGVKAGPNAAVNDKAADMVMDIPEKLISRMVFESRLRALTENWSRLSRDERLFLTRFDIYMKSSNFAESTDFLELFLGIKPGMVLEMPKENPVASVARRVYHAAEGRFGPIIKDDSPLLDIWDLKTVTGQEKLALIKQIASHGWTRIGQDLRTVWVEKKGDLDKNSLSVVYSYTALGNFIDLIIETIQADPDLLASWNAGRYARLVNSRDPEEWIRSMRDWLDLLQLMQGGDPRDFISYIRPGKEGIRIDHTPLMRSPFHLKWIGYYKNGPLNTAIFNRKHDWMAEAVAVIKALEAKRKNIKLEPSLEQRAALNAITADTEIAFSFERAISNIRLLKYIETCAASAGEVEGVTRLKKIDRQKALQEFRDISKAVDEWLRDPSFSAIQKIIAESPDDELVNRFGITGDQNVVIDEIFRRKMRQGPSPDYGEALLDMGIGILHYMEYQAYEKGLNKASGVAVLKAAVQEEMRKALYRTQEAKGRLVSSSEVVAVSSTEPLEVGGLLFDTRSTDISQVKTGWKQFQTSGPGIYSLEAPGTGVKGYPSEPMYHRAISNTPILERDALRSTGFDVIDTITYDVNLLPPNIVCLYPARVKAEPITTKSLGLALPSVKTDRARDRIAVIETMFNTTTPQLLLAGPAEGSGSTSLTVRQARAIVGQEDLGGIPRLSMQNFREELTTDRLIGVLSSDQVGKFRIKIVRQTMTSVLALIDEGMHADWGKSGLIAILMDTSDPDRPTVYMMMPVPLTHHQELRNGLLQIRKNLRELKKRYGFVLMDQTLYSPADTDGGGLTFAEGFKLSLDTLFERLKIDATKMRWQDLWVLAAEISWNDIHTFNQFSVAANRVFEVLGVRFASNEERSYATTELSFILGQSGFYERGLSYVNEATYPWIANIPAKWGYARQNVMHELDEMLSMPSRWGSFMLENSGDGEIGYEPIRTNRFMDIERKYRFIDRYARWAEVVDSVYGRYPFTYYDHGTTKVNDLDYFIMILKWKYSQSLGVFSLYDRLAREGLLDPNKVKRVFELGTGGWASAFMMPAAFPNFENAIGIDSGQQDTEYFEKLWRPIFGLTEEQFVLANGDYFKLEKPSWDGVFDNNFAKYGKADLAQIFRFLPSGDNQSYPKLFYQIGQRLNPDGVLIVQVKASDGGVLAGVRECFRNVECKELLDWHPDIGAFGVIAPDEVRVFVIKQPELVKLKMQMEKDAEQAIVNSHSRYDAIGMYDRLLELEPNNSYYMLQRATARLPFVTGDLRVNDEKDAIYYVSNSQHDIVHFFEDLMEASRLDQDGAHSEQINKLVIGIFQRIAVGSIVKTYPETVTAWSPTERKEYEKALRKVFKRGEDFGEIYRKVFGLDVTKSVVLLLRKKLEAVYKDYKAKKEARDSSESQESPSAFLIQILFRDISSVAHDSLSKYAVESSSRHEVSTLDPRLEPKGDGMDVPAEWEERAQRMAGAASIFRRLNIVPSFKLRTTKKPPVYPLPGLSNFEVTHIYQGCVNDISGIGLSGIGKTVHFMLLDHNNERIALNLCDPDTESILSDPALYSELKKLDNVRLFSLHLGFSAEKVEETEFGMQTSPSLADGAVRRIITENVMLFKRKLAEYGMGDREVLLENMMYFEGLNYVYKTQAIREVLEDTRCGLLLDLGHAVITARSGKSGIYGDSSEEPISYVRRILAGDVIRKLREIHISVPFYDDGKGVWRHGGKDGAPYGSLCLKTPGSKAVEELLLQILDLRKASGINSELIINLETDDEFAAKDAVRLEELLKDWEVSRIGASLNPPSTHDIRGKKLQVYKDMLEARLDGNVSRFNDLAEEQHMLHGMPAPEAREVAQSEKLANRIKILSSEAKLEKARVVVGIETAGWVPDEQMSDIQALTSEVRQLVDTLTRRGVLDNITVVLGNSDTLLSNVANEKPDKSDKVVLLGSEKTLTSDSYKSIEAFKACIDLRELGNLDYISLLEVLTVALNLGLDEETDAASKASHPGIGIETIGARIVRLIPSKKVDINEPSKVYRLQIKELAKQA